MQNITNKLNALVIEFLNQWIHYLDRFWLIVGVIFGFCISLAWLNRDNKACGFFIRIAILPLIFQLGFYFAIPSVSQYFTGEAFYLPDYYLLGFIAEALLAILLVWLTIRYGSPYFESIRGKLTKTSSLERNKKTDIRQISVHLPNPQKTYAPQKYFNLKKGVFFGLNEQKQPVYIPLSKFKSSHIQVAGKTGGGKGIAAGVLLTQAVSSGECVVVIDPKFDEWLPHVMRKAAQDAGVPYVYIDLQASTPQWNPIQHKDAAEIEELLSAGFLLGEKGTDADFYRLDDRRAARIFASLAFASKTTLIETLQLFLMQQPDIAEAAKSFVSNCEEIGLVSAVNTNNGVDLPDLIKQGAVIYVRGSMRNPRILKLQRIFVLSMIQHIEARARDNARHVCLFMDEFKYLISRPSLEALGAIRDKGAHVIIAHQSLGDLRDCPADLDPESVVASVNENCAIKLAYAVKDPDTADWLARMSGLILVDDEIRQVKTNAGLTEIRDGGRTLRQAERNLIDTNMLHALPDRCAVLFGGGLAQFFFTSPIMVSKTDEAITHVAVLQGISKSAQYDDHYTKAPLTTAQSMLDVD
jgi:TraM recognition site of TraD and TraG/Helicase HerA, central domain